MVEAGEEDAKGLVDPHTVCAQVVDVECLI
jgi:hypothetical protein